MREDIRERIQQYLGSDVSKMRLLGITKYAVATYVRRVQGGWSKQLAFEALMQGRLLDADQVAFVHSVVGRLPSAAVRGAGAF